MPYSHMNSKGVTYYLHRKKVVRKAGEPSLLFYFAKEPGPNAIDAVPPGRVVSETKNGLPVLKRA